MSLVNEWNDLLKNQTDDTFEDFWKEYSDAEMRIYDDILANNKVNFTGRFAALAEMYKVRPVIFCGFLDGIQDSLQDGALDMDAVDEDTEIDFTIDFAKLFTNMLKADARHLYSLKAWENIYTEDEGKELIKQYKRSKTIVKPKKIGRNDPCPCGSGKKYKYCCGRNAS